MEDSAVENRAVITPHCCIFLSVLSSETNSWTNRVGFYGGGWCVMVCAMFDDECWGAVVCIELWWYVMVCIGVRW